MLFPIKNEADDPITAAPTQPSVKVMHVVDGKPVEHKLSKVEQMLAEELARCFIMGQAITRMYKRNTFLMWCSVAANVVMLALFYI